MGQYGLPPPQPLGIFSDLLDLLQLVNSKRSVLTVDIRQCQLATHGKANNPCPDVLRS